MRTMLTGSVRVMALAALATGPVASLALAPIKVTNLWANRMIGDQLLPEEKRYTFRMFKPYKKDSPLLDSGLLGPVRLDRVTPQ